jgi:TM2 domain-containing membrane protein YozV
MSIWTKFSEDEEKKREAAFEAKMLAALAKDTTVAPVRDGIQITVTAKGQTAQYQNLADVPAPVRQQVLNAWQPAAPPVISLAASGPRQRSRRIAGMLNLFVPGAGQIYLGQRFVGSLFVLVFLGCFCTAIVIFVRAFTSYLQIATSGEVFEAGNLERLSTAFPVGALIGLSVVAMVIYIASAIHLSRSR